MRPAVVAALAVAGWFALSGSAAAAEFDFGDAPDGVSTGYVTGPQPPPIAGFPSLAASNGPRHADVRARLGVGADRERDSRQVDRDRFDDGAYFSRLAPCSRSQLTVLVNLRHMPLRVLRRAARADTNVFVNGWADWNRDGDWNDVVDCREGKANEWFAHNVQVPVRRVLGGAHPRSWKPRSAWVVPVNIHFRAGPQVSEFWWRTTLTLGQRVVQHGGAAARPYRFGETEDYRHLAPTESTLLRREPETTSPFSVGCGYSPLFREPRNAPVILMSHGQTAHVDFWLHNHNPEAAAPPVFARLLSLNGESVRLNRERRFGANWIRGWLRPRGERRVTGVSVRSRKRHATPWPFEFHQLVFEFRRRTGVAQPKFWTTRAFCKFLIIHITPMNAGPGAPPPAAAPPPAVEDEEAAVENGNGAPPDREEVGVDQEEEAGVIPGREEAGLYTGLGG